MQNHLEFQSHGNVELPKIKNKKIIIDMIDEEFCYQWIGHH
jgi:hypothetical protein